MPDQERYDAYLRRKERQAACQDDVKRGPFTKRFGDACKWCGCIHVSADEYRRCLLDNCG